jgi:hypothetical protein
MTSAGIYGGLEADAMGASVQQSLANLADVVAEATQEESWQTNTVNSFHKQVHFRHSTHIYCSRKNMLY